MKPLHCLALATLSLLLLNNSCHQDDGASCPTSLFAAVPGPTWRPNPRCFASSMTGAQSPLYLINSQAELRALYPCDSLPGFDFNAVTMLAGKTRTSSCSLVQGQAISVTCEKYTYRVTLVAGPCQAPSEVFYYQLVPKLPASAQVTLDVQLPQ